MLGIFLGAAVKSCEDRGREKFLFSAPCAVLAAGFSTAQSSSQHHGGAHFKLKGFRDVPGTDAVGIPKKKPANR
jgi:hypothetical protein